MAVEPTYLKRLEAWLDRTNARSDEISRSRPTWWHAGKIVFGLLFGVKAVSLFLSATGVGGYLLSAFFLIAGIALVTDGVAMLRERWRR